MNKVMLIGRMVRDPEVRYSQGANGQLAVARFSVAVDRRRAANNNDGQTADFISCVSFGRTAEFLEKYMRKGMRIALSGRIQTGSYTNRDGQKVYTTDVVAEEVEFAQSRQENTQSDGFAPAPSQPADGFSFMGDGIEEDLPFV